MNINDLYSQAAALQMNADFIDFNEINEGIVYVEGGIGLHQ
jgi:hypothetical protein